MTFRMGKESLARIAALDYMVSPDTFELAEDVCGIDGNPDNVSSLDVVFLPQTIEDSAVDVMTREGFDPGDFALQKEIGQRAIKYINILDDFEQIKARRQQAADRLNDYVH